MRRFKSHECSLYECLTWVADPNTIGNVSGGLIVSELDTSQDVPESRVQVTTELSSRRQFPRPTSIWLGLCRIMYSTHRHSPRLGRIMLPGKGEIPEMPWTKILPGFYTTLIRHCVSLVSDAKITALALSIFAWLFRFSDSKFEDACHNNCSLS